MDEIRKMAADLAQEVLENSDDPWLLDKAQELKTQIIIYEDELSQDSD